MSKRVLFLFAFVCCAISALADAVPAQLRVPFTAGVAGFPPLQKSLTDPRFATLPATSDGRFYVVTGKNADGAEVWWLLRKKADGTSMLTLLSMEKDNAGTLKTAPMLQLDEASDATTSLELQVPNRGDVLLYRWSAGDASTIAVGKPLPDFVLTARDGHVVPVAELRDAIVVLNSWATWCVPCVEEIPSLNRLVETYARRGVKFVAILEPKASDDLTVFLKKHPFTYRHMVATDSSRLVFGDAYPRHVVLGADGNVVYTSTGGSTHADRELSSVLDRLLAN